MIVRKAQGQVTTVTGACDVTNLYRLKKGVQIAVSPYAAEGGPGLLYCQGSCIVKPALTDSHPHSTLPKLGTTALLEYLS